MATVPAVVGTARVGNFRVGYVSAALAALRAVRFTVVINSTERSHNVDRYSIEIIDDLNEAPNTCSFDCFGFTPALSQTVKITYAGPTSKEFDGTITGITEYHDKLSARTLYRVTCTDHTRELDARLVTKAFGSQSGTAIAQSIATTYFSTFTQTHIAAALPTVPAIQFKMTPGSSAYRQLCDAIGGDTYADYDSDLHVFLTETDVLPDTLTTSSTNWKTLKYSRMIDKVVNRIYVEGQGTFVLFDVPVGDTIIPVESLSMFSSSGGLAVINNQVITYTGTTKAAPSTAPNGAGASGSGLTTGSTYADEYTFVTGSGETTPSPLGSFTPGSAAISAPSTALTITDNQAPHNAWTNGDQEDFAVTFITATGETTRGPTATIIITAGSVNLSNIPLGPGGTTARRVYRKQYSGTTPTGTILYTQINDNTSTTFNDYAYSVAETVYSNSGVFGPTTNTATASYNAANITGISVGPTGTTSRKLYRTIANGSTGKLLTTLSDNITTSYSGDGAADGTLGADAPTTDTSGLTTAGFALTSGATSAASTTLVLTSSAVFSATGGWALLGNTAIRYSSTSGGTTLTGIPTSGAGAIPASVPSGSFVEVAPGLTGVPASGTGSITNSISAGDDINMIVQRDDTTSQASYGIREAYIQDRRLSIAGAQARGDAELVLKKDPFVSGSFITTDTKVRTGRRVTITVSEWSISGTYTITRVRIFWKEGDQRPQREVTFASNTGQSDLYRILRRLRENQQQDAA